MNPTILTRGANIFFKDKAAAAIPLRSMPRPLHC